MSKVMTDFWSIYDLYHRPVKSFIIKMVGEPWAAEDLTQETFIKVQQKISQLHDDSKIRPWIYQIARNVCIDYFRGRRNKEDKSDDIEELQLTIQPMVHNHIEQNQMSQCVQDKIQLLPDTLRDILILSEIKDLNQQEIAEILDISLSNVKVRLHRARKALKEILKRDCLFEHDDRNVMVCIPKDD